MHPQLSDMIDGLIVSEKKVMYASALHDYPRSNFCAIFSGTSELLRIIFGKHF